MGKTRSFTGARGEIALVPFGDLLNHGWPRAGRNLTARLEVDVMYGPTVGDDGVRVFAFTASEYIGPGEEVFDTYTRESNEGIMLRYGFVVPGNPRDRITLPLAPGQSPPELLSTRVVSSVINISAPLGEMRDPVIEARLSAAIRSFLKKDEAGGPGGDGGVMSAARALPRAREVRGRGLTSCDGTPPPQARRGRRRSSPTSRARWRSSVCVRSSSTATPPQSSKTPRWWPGGASPSAGRPPSSTAWSGSTSSSRG